jgi:predicted HAD superfamily Cof-like phosphohydrolase
MNSKGNPIFDQQEFMEACDQSTGYWNEKQASLYKTLIKEEDKELELAFEEGSIFDQSKEAIDGIVVRLGLLHSIWPDAQGAWDAVHKSNVDKIDPYTSKVRKREDGKILKPDGWKYPDLKQLWESQLANSKR